MRGIVERKIFQASCEKCRALFEDDGHNCYDSLDEIKHELEQNGWVIDPKIECPDCFNKYYQKNKTSHL
ncbi:hypothetical protein [Myroides odoratus]|uniref:Uncharacterized protein n=1 Tax=Myroides odoratus TaxID=256 RepID=A0A9Q6Z5V6_MYROD|nr:hypothetical protein [Myroides odoratus]EHQ41507.1 hypothetical protein Myrod_0671 [Myroides odoratus DSM 2801]EKB02700.1 hypothetical protein HMPREF9716_03729 [Myroides odoratus CIP 103059]QQT98931.1 hypothetical protein I6I88_11975 [Myroides odoratus]WQD58883.1 hypothetical protein U0010_07000 [Myroides odoratus]STZ28770.1 Uncharacterised protein [Myroides odoratus]